MSVLLERRLIKRLIQSDVIHFSHAASGDPSAFKFCHTRKSPTRILLTRPEHGQLRAAAVLLTEVRNKVIQALDVVRLGHALAWTIPGMSRIVSAAGMPHCSGAELLEVASAKNGSHDKGTWIGTAIAEEPLKHILATPCGSAATSTNLQSLTQQTLSERCACGDGLQGLAPDPRS